MTSCGGASKGAGADESTVHVCDLAVQWDLGLYMTLHLIVSREHVFREEKK